MFFQYPILNHLKMDSETADNRSLMQSNVDSSLDESDNESTIRRRKVITYKLGKAYNMSVMTSTSEVKKIRVYGIIAENKIVYDGIHSLPGTSAEGMSVETEPTTERAQETQTSIDNIQKRLEETEEPVPSTSGTAKPITTGYQRQNNDWSSSYSSTDDSTDKSSLDSSSEGWVRNDVYATSSPIKRKKRKVSHPSCSDDESDLQESLSRTSLQSFTPKNVRDWIISLEKTEPAGGRISPKINRTACYNKYKAAMKRSRMNSKIGSTTAVSTATSVKPIDCENRFARLEQRRNLRVSKLGKSTAVEPSVLPKNDTDTGSIDQPPVSKLGNSTADEPITITINDTDSESIDESIITITDTDTESIDESPMSKLGNNAAVEPPIMPINNTNIESIDESPKPEEVKDNTACIKINKVKKKKIQLRTRKRRKYNMRTRTSKQRAEMPFDPPARNLRSSKLKVKNLKYANIDRKATKKILPQKSKKTTTIKTDLKNVAEKIDETKSAESIDENMIKTNENTASTLTIEPRPLNEAKPSEIPSTSSSVAQSPANTTPPKCTDLSSSTTSPENATQKKSSPKYHKPGRLFNKYKTLMKRHAERQRQERNSQPSKTRGRPKKIFKDK